MVSLFSSLMESNFLFWRKSCAIRSIFNEYQWYLIGKRSGRDFFFFFCKWKILFLRTYGLMPFFLSRWNFSSRNASIRIRIFLKENLLADDWAVTRTLFQCQMGIRCPVLIDFQHLTAICSFVNLSLIWSNWLLPMYLYLLLWGMCEEECVAGRFGLFLKKSIICVLAVTWMWQYKKCGLQTCRVGEDESRIHLLVTLLCQ